MAILLNWQHCNSRHPIANLQQTYHAYPSKMEEDLLEPQEKSVVVHIYENSKKIHAFRIFPERFRRAERPESDLELVRLALCDKKPEYSSVFRHPRCVFSYSNDGGGLEIGFSSPINNKSILICTFPEDINTLKDITLSLNSSTIHSTKNQITGSLKLYW